MNKNDIDCLELGHSKSREKEVASAEERAERAQARRKMLGFLRKLAFLQHPASSMSKPQAIRKHNISRKKLFDSKRSQSCVIKYLLIIQ